MRTFEAVLFDFDYTLADSSRGIIACANYALREMGLPEASPDVIRPLIGLSLPDMLPKLVGAQHAGRTDEFSRLFVERADQIMSDLTSIFPEVPETIATLKRCGLALGIVSTKFRYRIMTTLQREGLAQAFDVIVGGEDVAAHKPAPEGLLKAVERLGCTTGNTLYVGDSVTDAEAAKRAGMPFVAVLSGVTPGYQFVSYPSYHILNSVAELPPLLGCSRA